MADMDTERIIRDFIAAWSRLDAAELAGHFAEDATYHNMPMEPVSGLANIEGFIARFVEPWTETKWEIVSLAAAGVFEMADGKIKAWRDYFDMATYAAAMR